MPGTHAPMERSMNGKLIVVFVLSLMVAYAGLAGFSRSSRAAAAGRAGQQDTASSEKGANCRTVSFKRDVLPAFQESCVACHYDKNQMPGLDLSPSSAYADLVNRKSHLNPNLVLVKPSSPVKSFLLEKLSRKPRFGAAMPAYGKPLTPAQKTLLTEWIKQGAKDN